MRRVVLLSACLLLAGCGGKPKPELIPLEKVPEAIRTTAKETLPEVKFDQAIRRPDGGYEVRGKDASGKVRDVEFSKDGKVIEVE